MVGWAHCELLFLSGCGMWNLTEKHASLTLVDIGVGALPLVMLWATEIFAFASKPGDAPATAHTTVLVRHVNAPEMEVSSNQCHVWAAQAIRDIHTLKVHLLPFFLLFFWCG